MPKQITRTQTGLRLERSLLKVMKATAEYCDMTLGDLVEGIVLHAFDGKTPFSAETLEAIAAFKSLYGCNLDAADSHQMQEVGQ